MPIVDLRAQAIQRSPEAMAVTNASRQGVPPRASKALRRSTITAASSGSGTSALRKVRRRRSNWECAERSNMSDISRLSFTSRSARG